jgi:hypothetical protein
MKYNKENSWLDFLITGVPNDPVLPQPKEKDKKKKVIVSQKQRRAITNAE